MSDLATVLARMLLLRIGDESWEEHKAEMAMVYSPEADPLRDIAHEWYDSAGVIADDMLATPEGKALAALVEAALAWRDKPWHLRRDDLLADAIDAYREATR